MDYTTILFLFVLFVLLTRKSESLNYERRGRGKL